MTRNAKCRWIKWDTYWYWWRFVTRGGAQRIRKI